MLDHFLDGESALVAMLCLMGGVLLGSVLIGARKDLYLERNRFYLYAAYLIGMGLMAGAFLALVAFSDLIYRFILSDFQYRLVAAHSHGAAPLSHKIGAVWSSHEGSLLLWFAVMALYGGVYGAMTLKNLEQSRIANHPNSADVSSTQTLLPVIRSGQMHLVLLGVFGIFLYGTANPFDRLGFIVPEGAELNPLLQDGSLMVHPPLLYLGYVGFSLVFSVTWGGLMARIPLGQVARNVLPYLLISLGFLTFGIALGAFWAYYELGWGGYWFWDPVETISLLPWLSGLAAVHGFIKNAKPTYSGVFWAILTFPCGVLGTFLVRSGLLSSVHSFADQGDRAVQLAVFCAVILSLGGWAIHRHRTFATHPGPLWPLTLRRLSRPLFLSVAMTLLGILFVLGVLGTLYPVVLDAFGGGKIVVGSSFFQKTFIPVSVLGLLILTYVFYGGQYGYLLNTSTLGVAVGSMVLIYGADLAPNLSAQTLVYVGLTIFMTASAIIAIKRRASGHRLSFVMKHLSHGGALLLALGLAVNHMGAREENHTLKPGDGVNIQDHRLDFHGTSFVPAPTFVAERAHITMTHKKGAKTTVYPEKRLYLAHQGMTTETALYHHGLDDFLIILGGLVDQDRYIVRVMYQPWIQVVWFGALCMGLGFFFSLICRQSYRRRALKGG